AARCPRHAPRGHGPPPASAPLPQWARAPPRCSRSRHPDSGRPSSSQPPRRSRAEFVDAGFPAGVTPRYSVTSGVTTLPTARHHLSPLVARLKPIVTLPGAIVVSLWLHCGSINSLLISGLRHHEAFE